MPKIAPENRWRMEVLERFAAFRISEEFVYLRRKGLKALGRKTRLDSEAYWEESRIGRSMTSTSYKDFLLGCKKVGDQFGLNAWVVEMACMVKGYSPTKYPYVLERTWPEFKVITEQTSEPFIRHLVWETRALHIERLKNGALRLPDPMVVKQPASYFVPNRIEPPDLPPRDSGFKVSLEFPAGYPPEARADMARASGQFERELARRMGYIVAQRMRSYSLNPRQLRIDQSPLPSGGIYEIMDEVYGEIDLSLDQTIRSRVKTLRKRLIDRFRIRFGFGSFR